MKGDDYHILFLFYKNQLVLFLVARRKLFVFRGHPDLNRGPLDLQSNALPLSYMPIIERDF